MGHKVVGSNPTATMGLKANSLGNLICQITMMQLDEASQHFNAHDEKAHWNFLTHHNRTCKRTFQDVKRNDKFLRQRQRQRCVGVGVLPE